MDTHPYHNYWFFEVSASYYQLSSADQTILKQEFVALIEDQTKLVITSYGTGGFKAQTSLMLWVRSTDPATSQKLFSLIRRTKLGLYLTLSFSYFGIVRNSTYSGRTGKPEQVIQNFTDRLPYLIVYPFTKTHAWHQLNFDDRKAIMGEHVKVGLSHPEIRQCLLYSYGIDDYEFVVSYETSSLEDFQDLVTQMRATRGRPYTLTDIPMFVCLYQPLDQLL